MSLIDVANPMTPQKPCHMNSDVYSPEDQSSTPELPLNSQSSLKTPNRGKLVSKGTPEFKNFTKSALGIQDSNKKENIRKTIEDAFSGYDSSGQKKAAVLSKTDATSISARKSFLKSNRLELVGVLVSGKPYVACNYYSKQ